MSDPTFNQIGFAVYTADRDPTTSEPTLLPFGREWVFFWKNLENNKLFYCVNPGEDDPLLWGRLPSDLPMPISEGGTGATTISGIKSTLGIISGTTRSYSTRSSPAFNTNYTPSSTQDTLVVANLRMQVTILQSCTIDIQVDDGAGGSFQTINTISVSGVAIDRKDTVSFIVPANCQYKLISSGTGTNTIISVKEVNL